MVVASSRAHGSVTSPMLSATVPRSLLLWGLSYVRLGRCGFEGMLNQAQVVFTIFPQGLNSPPSSSGSSSRYVPIQVALDRHETASC